MAVPRRLGNGNNLGSLWCKSPRISEFIEIFSATTVNHTFCFLLVSKRCTSISFRMFIKYAGVAPPHSTSLVSFSCGGTAHLRKWGVQDNRNYGNSAFCSVRTCIHQFQEFNVLCLHAAQCGRGKCQLSVRYMLCTRKCQHSEAGKWGKYRICEHS